MTPSEALASGSLDLLAFLVVGLLGGAHCLGMCGPLVSLYAGKFDDDPDRLTPRELRQHALFNLGRTGGYALVGGLCGLLGAVLFDASTFVGVGETVRGVVGVAVGIAVFGAGVTYLRGSGGGLHDLPVGGELFGRVTGALTARVDRWAGDSRVLGLGAVHALLPCPLLYPAYLAAFALGSPTRGALALTALGIGTVPTVLLVGVSVGRFSATGRRRLHRALGAAFVLLALLPLTMGLASLGVPVPSIHLPTAEVTDVLFAL
jgi:sulfite exporter TauE/SafE